MMDCSKSTTMLINFQELWFIFLHTIHQRRINDYLTRSYFKLTGFLISLYFQRLFPRFNRLNDFVISFSDRM